MIPMEAISVVSTLTCSLTKFGLSLQVGLALPRNIIAHDPCMDYTVPRLEHPAMALTKSIALRVQVPNTHILT